MPEQPTSTRPGVSGIQDAEAPVPSWLVGLCGVAAVASVLFSILLFLNR
jgi:hypothetical protein